MALSILDGNQSATTLSTIVTSGQHIPAHTVVSLGTQAISNITTAVSGTAVTFGLVGGTVTANNFTLTNVLQYDGSHYFLKVGGVATTGGTSFPVYVAGSVTVGNSVTIGSALPAGTNRIGVVTIGAGTVTIGSGTAQIGSVTASLSGWELLGQRDFFADASNWVFNSSTIGLYSSLGITFGDGSSGSIQSTYLANFGQDNDLYWSSSEGARTRVISSGTGLLTTMAIPADITISINSAPSSSQTASLYGKKDNVLPLTNTQLRGSAVAISGTVTASISNSVTIASLPAISGTVTIGSALPAGTFQIGSVTAVNHQGTTVTTSNFTSTTPSTVIASANSGREVLTIFNEGAGNLHICAGATCTTIAYQVRLSAGDYYEVPLNQTSLTHSAVFATAGTARVCQVS
jgi:hypothetical protein